MSTSNLASSPVNLNFEFDEDCFGAVHKRRPHSGGEGG